MRTRTGSSAPTPADSPTRWWDLPAAFLVLTALVVAASRLVATRWTDDLNIVQTSIFLGVLAGLALGQSAFSPRWAVFFALSYGLFVVPWQLGITLESDVLWGDRLLSLGARMSNALGQLARQEAVEDPLLFLFLMTGLSWALGVHAGYTVTRYGRPWRATLPAGLMLLIIHVSDPHVASRIWHLAIYLFLTLLLLARLTYLRYHAEWRQAQAHVSSLVAWDLTRIVLVATTVLVLLAWGIPALADALPAAQEAWREATRPVRVRMQERMDNAFAALRRAVGMTTIVDRYGGNLSLGQGKRLSDELVFTVQAPLYTDAVVRYYWRARVYDRYADGEWSGDIYSTTLSVFPDNPSPAFPESVRAVEGRRTITVTYTPAVPIATLYAASQPQWVSRHIHIGLAHNPDGTSDTSAWQAVPPVYAGETYEARSSLSNVTVAELHEAGDDYPRWVVDRYLQLPPSITPRTQELARQITAGMDDPYDIVAAVTGYLRTAIRYAETVSPPPPDQEPLDWFLFDLRQGFCNYYASSEVILLRSLGIPARLAVGYAEGERQARSRTYLVRQRDAHAWPEVYFPGVGWVEFEPTASQAPLHRPLGEERADASDVGGTEDAGEVRDRWEGRLDELLALGDEPSFDSPGSAPPAESPRARLLSWALFLGLGMVLIALVWRHRRQRGLSPLPILLEVGLRRFDLEPPPLLHRWALQASLSPLARAYLELNRALVRLGAAPKPADTPAERAASLERVLPATADPAQRLLTEYHATIYGSSPGDSYVAQQAGRVLRSLAWQADIKRRVGNALHPLRVFVRRLTSASYHSPR
jgi:transglutaminase-like putative cysteine protease